MFKKTITTSLSPNVNKAQLKECLLSILNPFSYKNWIFGDNREKLENLFCDYFNTRNCLSFGSGRAALYFLLKAFGVKEGDEVIIQAYTCVSVPNTVIWLKAKPVYVDVRDDFNIDPELIERKISQNSKVIIVQHTFGKPAEIEKIQSIARKYNLIVIEDVAHALGANVHGRKVGTFGDGAIFSFGRDKVISSVTGGLAILKNENIFRRLKEKQEELGNLSHFEIFRFLLNPILGTIVNKTYGLLGFGKFVSYLAKKTKITPLVLTQAEKDGRMSPGLFFKIPNILARLAMIQFQELKQSNDERIKKAEYYTTELSKEKRIIIPTQQKNEKHIFMRYTIQVENGEELREFAKKENIILGDWYNFVIAPKGTNLSNIGYQEGVCPHAEKIASRSVNLPNHGRIRRADLERIIVVIKRYLSRKNG